MTVVAVWYESGEDRVWCVADTRVSRPGEFGGRIVLTDYAAKIFSLSVKCIGIMDDIDNRVPFFDKNFGFAFAGDALPALMTFSTSNALLQQLTAVNKYEIPSLKQITELIRKLAQRYMNEVWSANNRQGLAGLFEAVVFGYCTNAKEFEIQKLDFIKKEGKISVSSTNMFSHTEVVVLGNGKQRFYENLENLKRNGDPIGRKLRLPKLAVKAMVDSSESTSDVGGNTSVGSALKSGFRIYYSAEPIFKGQSQGFRHYNGIDLDHELIIPWPFTIGDVGMI